MGWPCTFLNHLLGTTEFRMPLTNVVLALNQDTLHTDNNFVLALNQDTLHTDNNFVLAFTLHTDNNAVLALNQESMAFTLMF
jgi:uncharacterized protein (AIM24 family)